jgi:hypothetical protein
MIAAVTFIYHGGSSLLEKSLGVKDRAHWVRRMGHPSTRPVDELRSSRSGQVEHGAQSKRNTPGSMLAAKTEPFSKTISANLFIISPKQVNWKNHHGRSG